MIEPTPASLPEFIAHADWGTDTRKRQVAVARHEHSGYAIVKLHEALQTAVERGDVRAALHVPEVSSGCLLAGFDFPIGLPVDYAKQVGIASFPDFLSRFGVEPFQDFAIVATTAAEISLYRPFYPYRPGGTLREHLYSALDLTSEQLRRRCEGRDAETMFWTLGGKQVGKAALSGWSFLASSEDSIGYWPFDGSLTSLLSEAYPIVVAETYPREFYRHINPGLPRSRPWSKTRQEDRLTWVPRLLEWAKELNVSWEASVLQRVEIGFSPGPNGEDEFDAIVGLLGMIAVTIGALPSGEPDGDVSVSTVEGWIVGRLA